MSDASSGGGVSLATVLVAIFVTLKLTDVIDWSWWWVFSPWLFGTAIALFIYLILFLLLVIDDLDAGRKRKSVPYTRPQDHDVSHIEPLDSIKNPRKS